MKLFALQVPSQKEPVQITLNAKSKGHFHAIRTTESLSGVTSATLNVGNCLPSGAKDGRANTRVVTLDVSRSEP